ncbi:putative bifunctional diguanylate cyclase/phosphodiesterase [Salinispirillum marinum]|uniref:Bifunctional diguanylate cyclase/phosphodiesterase n=2 Tax=Saccharospirillaceae TaxID=255527 RepID=A0ABV8BH52_9GAMM
MSSTTKTALRLALTYIVMGSLWILFSDRALALFVQDAAQLSQLQTAKGWAFVLLTGLLFFVLARRALTRELALSERDALTQLLNRHMFRRELDNELRLAVQSGEYLTLLHLNMDGFRQINNTAGQAVGDELLRHVADVLRDQFDTRAVIGRLAGDEFAVSLRGLAWDTELVPELSAIQQKISTIRLPAHPSVGLTSCIGAAHFPVDGLNSKSLMAAAALALDEAKQHGVGEFRLYNQNYGDDVHSRQQLILDFKTALAEDGLSVVYQPQIDCRTRQISGVEVLVRWIREDGVAVRPDQFIPLAEQQGMIGLVTDFVCRQAIQELKAAKLLGSVLPRVSLNISAMDFNGTESLKRFVCLFADHEVEPSWIQLEITETAVMNNVEGSISALQGLREHGFQISVDDFGTGYSSLSMLRRLPVQELKIDQSFIRDIPHDHNDCSIVRTILAMSAALGLRTVAEGVETDAQAAFLLEHVCTELQGYRFARPMPIADLEAFIATYRAA